MFPIAVAFCEIIQVLGLWSVLQPELFWLKFDVGRQFTEASPSRKGS